MATAAEIIQRAYRESNLIAIGSTPTAAEQTEGLSLLNSLIQSTIGSEVGLPLTDLNVGGTYDQTAFCSPWIPENVRLILNLTGPLTFKLDPMPYDGQRFAIVDSANTLDTCNLTLDGNGRTLELDATELFNTEGLVAEFMYRADQANWVRVTDLVATDDMPFPTEYDDYFIVMLAVRLNPRHSRNLTPESQMALQRQRSQIQARYRKPRTPNDPGSLGLLHQRRGPFGESTAAFNSGRT
jgi:hypothetical protein